MMFFVFAFFEQFVRHTRARSSSYRRTIPTGLMPITYRARATSCNDLLVEEEHVQALKHPLHAHRPHNVPLFGIPDTPSRDNVVRVIVYNARGCNCWHVEPVFTDNDHEAFPLDSPAPVSIRSFPGL